MALLELIRGPEDVRRLSRRHVQPLADEVRRRLIDVVSQTGGHIGAGLGVVELTVALCYSFDSPRDKIVWDVGHQAYPWKILTGRNERLPTLRQPGGLSGFLRRSERPPGWRRVGRRSLRPVRIFQGYAWCPTSHTILSRGESKL